jgi:hypothetical protein
MQIINGIKKRLVNILLISSLIGCNVNSDKNNYTQKDININQIITKLVIEKSIKKPIWEHIEEYDSFVRSKVDKYFFLDVDEMYKFYSIKRNFPKYGFKPKEEGFLCIECEGAEYNKETDSIYFYSACPKERFMRYIKYLEEDEKDKENIKDNLTDRIHHYIKHEAAHSFYYNLGKELGEKYLFNIDVNSLSKLESIQFRLVEEGVADYMAYKGELTSSAKKIDDRNFKEMIENKDDFYLYELGFKLVKPILDINFEKGIEELIKNPLTKEDLNDLLQYRQRILKKIK